MNRPRPLTWQAALAVLALALGMLGDTCESGGRVASAPKPAPTASPRDSIPAPTVSVEAAAETQASVSPTPAGPTFEAAVRPILAVKCAPCHNPGGKMYERMPFDQPQVVSSHAKGVRRRLTGEDLRVFERWMATLPPEKPVGDSWVDKPGG